MRGGAGHGGDAAVLGAGVELGAGAGASVRLPARSSRPWALILVCA